MQSSLKSALGLAAIIFGAVMPAGAQTISTVSSWNGSDFAFPFGTSQTATYGEVITAPSSQLNNFTFYFKHYNGDSYQTNAFVYAWNGTNAVGPALASSGPYTVANGPDFAPITFATPANLTIGQQYVLFVNTSAFYGPDNGSYVGAIYTDPYPGGQYVFDNNAGDFGLLTTTTWDHYSNTALNQNFTFGNGYDLAFTANFAPIPEASTMASFGLLLILGLGGLVVAKKRKKSAA